MTCKVYLYPNGGELSQDYIEVTYNETYVDLPTPSRGNYTFQGWYKSTIGDERITPDSIVDIASSIGLYARWLGQSVTVHFVDEADSQPIDDKEVFFGGTYGELIKPVRNGYRFTGWYLSDEIATEITSITSVTNNQDHTLYAGWEEIGYRVTFDANEGAVSEESKYVLYGDPYGGLPTPTYKGHTFTGWYTLPYTGTEVTSESRYSIDQAQTLYAHWEPNEYTVQLYGDGAELPYDRMIVTYRGNYSNLPTPTMDHYTFDGWYTSSSGGTKITNSTEVKITSEQALYAHWVGDSQTVIFDADGGSIDTYQMTVSYGSTYGTLPKPTKTGYVFDGWYTSAGGDIQVTSNETVRFVNTQTIYARWSRKTPTITFDANGGSVLYNGQRVEEYEIDLLYGDTYGQLSVPSRQGYTFDGWYTSSTGGDQIVSSTVITITNSKTLYAHWIGNVYTVHFQPGEGEVSYANKIVVYEEAYGDLPTPIRENYEFLGWYTEQKGGKKITASSKVNIVGEQTLYASWRGANSKITFDPCGGYTPDSSKTVYYKEPYGEFPVAVERGLDFLGWYTAMEGGSKVTEEDIVDFTTGQTLYARWNKSDYVITFVTVGGTVYPESKLVHFEETYGTLPTPVRPGYTFGGWYLSESYYTLVMENTVVTTTVNKNLYAQWIGNTYTITLDANGGTNTTTNKSVTMGQSYGTLGTPKRSGYTFDGWYTKVSGGTKVTASSSVNIPDSHTLYAHWKSEVYTVTFNANGGTVDTKNTTVIKGTTYHDLPIPTREGYTFEGWYTSTTGGSRVYYTTVADTLYAHWSPNTYTVFLNGNSGSVSTSSLQVIYDEDYGYLPIPTKANYEFIGWYTAETGGSKKTSTSSVTIAENHTLYARWSGIDSKLSYNANGGTDLTSTKTITYGETYGTLTTPKRTGYTFDGWYTSATEGTLITADSLVNTIVDQTLYARWIVSTPTIKFRGNGGLILENGEYVTEVSVAKTYGTPYGKMPKVTRLGYTFVGWFTSTTGSNQVTENTLVEVSGIDYLYARWEQNYYTIQLDANGGAVDTSSVVLCYGDDYGTLPTPYLTGYDFDGWYTERIGGTKITSGTTVEILETQTLYAHWKLTTYTVTYDGNGGTIVVDGNSVSASSKKVGYLSTYGFQYGELPSAKRSGYHFVGWYTNSEGGEQITHKTEFIVNADQRVYAHWIPENISVQFHVNGGNALETTKTVEYGSMYGELPIPTRSNYSFEGCFTTKTGSVEVTVATEMTKTSVHTLYARWTPKQCKLSFDANGGLVNNGEQYVTYDQEYGELPIPTRTDYKFTGWYTKKIGGTKITSTNIVDFFSDSTLYAHWTQESFMLSCDPKGGTQYWDAKEAFYLQAYGTLPYVTRTGYMLEGWYDAEYNGKLVTELTFILTNKAHTLYAYWREKTPTILFHGNGGNVSPTSVVVVYGKTYGALPTPTLEHYTFDGWYTSHTGGTLVDEGSIVETEDTLTLYAHWTPDTYTVTFNGNGGAVTDTTKEVSYEDNYGVLPMPEKKVVNSQAGLPKQRVENW